MMGCPWLMAVAIATQVSATDSLALLAARAPESALILEVRGRPLVARDALTQALAHAAKGREEHLATARRVAAAYAVAWSDSFLVRDVERFAAWPVARRAGR